MLALENAVIGGDFRVVRPLAAGGMGGVYLAEQISTGQQRALKLMHPTLVANQRMRERFEQEARIGGRVPSEHVVQVIGAGVDANLGVPWLAMELLAGEDLAAFAARRGAVPFAEVIAIFRQLCHALGAAHSVGIVHRDVKPENVFLATVHSAEASSQLKMLDFGIAKLQAEAHESATGQVGTPLWMAPEQSDPRQAVTPAADVWALGLIAFRLLVGRHYWRTANDPSGALPALFRESFVEPLVSASERAREYGAEHLLPPGFDAWFARVVVREPERRFANANEAFAALEALGAGMAQTAPSVPQQGFGAAYTPVPVPDPSRVSQPSYHHFGASTAGAVMTSAPPPKSSKALWFVLGGGVLLLLLIAGVSVLGAGAYFYQSGASTTAPSARAAATGSAAAAAPTAADPSTASSAETTGANSTAKRGNTTTKGTTPGATQPTTTATGATPAGPTPAAPETPAPTTTG
jgi:serine/threonine protein kinase